MKLYATLSRTTFLGALLFMSGCALTVANSNKLDEKSYEVEVGGNGFAGPVDLTKKLREKAQVLCKGSPYTVEEKGTKREVDMAAFAVTGMSMKKPVMTAIVRCK